jgi:hypothetical protein
MHAPSWPISPGFAIDQKVNDEIGLATAGVVDHSIAWEQPHWVYMAYHPEIPQFMSRIPNPIPVPPGAPTDAASMALRFSRYVIMPEPATPRLHVYSFPQIPLYGHAIPIRVPDLKSSGVTWIGDVLFALGPEWIFAAGNDVNQRHQGRDKYIVLPFAEESSQSGADSQINVRFSSVVYGLGENDDLEFRYDLRIDDKLVASTDWRPTPDAQLEANGLKAGNSLLTIHVRNKNAGGTVYSSQLDVRSTKPQFRN